MKARNVAMIVFGAIVFATIIFLGWNHHGPNTFEAAFQPGGNVKLDLSVGGFTVRGSTENKIRVEIDPADLSAAHSEVIVNGNSAKVILDGPSNNFHATIFVPQQSNVSAFQTIGDLRIIGVEGNKDAALNVGKIFIEVPDPVAVRSVNASARIGNVHAAVWHSGHGGFFPSFRATGQGNYSVSASVDIGDIELGN